MGAFITDNDPPRIYDVSMDELCYMLFEFEKFGRRHRHIRVVRDDVIKEYQEDLGPADGSSQIGLSGGEPERGLDATVGTLIDVANYFKLHPFKLEGIVRTDLVAAYHDVMDQRRLVTGGN